MVCLCPKLKMVYGYCQHRVCEDCLYNEDNARHPCMQKCPTCQIEDAFPVFRPDIPEDSIELQKCLGVRSCTNKGCTVEMWEWEMEDHLRVCPNRLQSTPSRRNSVGTPECKKEKKKIRSQKQKQQFKVQRRSLRSDRLRRFTLS